MKKFICSFDTKNVLFTTLLCFSTSVFSSSIRLSDSVDLTLDNNGNLDVISRYMTYYAVKAKSGNGNYGTFEIVQPVDKKLKASLGSIEFEGLRPKLTFDPSIEFDTEKTDVLISDILPAGTSFKNSELYFRGASLIDLFNQPPSSSDERAYAVVLLVLNSLILPEIVAEGMANFGAMSKEKRKKVIENLLTFSNSVADWKKNLAKWNAALSMTEAVIEIIDAITTEMGVSNPELLDEVRPYYAGFKVIKTLSSKLESLSKKVIPRDDDIKDKIKKSIAEKYIEAGLSTTGKVEDQVWSDVGKAYKKSSYKHKFLIFSFLKAFKDGLSAWEDKEGNEETKRNIQRGKLLLGLTAIIFASGDVKQIIDNDPDAALQFIFDLAMGATQEVLTYKNVSLIAQNAANKFIGQNAGSAVSSVAKKGGTIVAAFKAGEGVANRLLPFLFDYIGAPNHLTASIIDNQLSLFGQLEKHVQLYKMNTDSGDPELLWDSQITAVDSPTIRVARNDDLWAYVGMEQKGLFGERALWNTSGYVAPQELFSAYISQGDNYSFVDSCLRRLGFFVSPRITLRRGVSSFGEDYIPPQCADGSLTGNSDFFTENGERLKLFEDDDFPEDYRLEVMDVVNNPIAGLRFDVNDELRPVIIQVSGIASSGYNQTVIQLVNGLDDIQFEASIPNSEPEESKIRDFTAQAQNAINDPIVSYVWDWGDGSQPHSSTNPSASYAYENTGYYTVTLTVTTEYGIINTVEQEIYIGLQVDSPTNLTATAGDGRVSLNWDAITSNTEGYMVHWAKESFAGLDPANYSALEGYSHAAQMGGHVPPGSPPSNSRSYEVEGLENGVKYYFVVQDLLSIEEGLSLPSNEVYATPTIPVASTGKLPKTGISKCGDYAYDGGSENPNSDLDCNQTTDSDGDPIPAGQDGHYQAGQDRSYTKVAGYEDKCVVDNVTGLMWEMKQPSGLHNYYDTYNWYSTDSSNNGGFAGYQDDDGDICYGYQAGVPSTYCNTQAYVARVNSEGWCGHKNWRMPTRMELQILADKGKYNPAIDKNYFPNTMVSSVYWSGSPYAYNAYHAWHVIFNYGSPNDSHKRNRKHVLLVRSVTP